MYDQLRIKEDLCYKVGCELKKTAGIVGITFYIQSEKEHPIYLQLRVLDFIDTFFYHKFDQKLFDEYKQGVIEKLKTPFPSIHQEAASLGDSIFQWSLQNDQNIDWTTNKKKISYMENYCTFNEVKQFYKELFMPYKREEASYTAEQITNLTKQELLQDNPYIGIESVVVFMTNKGISFDDQEAIKKIRMQDILTHVDNEFGQKSFLCARVFSKKLEHMV